MKILIINHEFPPVGGGGATSSEMLAGGFVKQGHSVRVLTSAFGDLPRTVTQDGYTVYRVSMGRTRDNGSTAAQMLRFVFSATRKGHQLVDEDPPDCVFACFALPAGWAARNITRKRGIPYVISLQGHDVPGLLPHVVGKYQRLSMPITRRVWRGAGTLVANSDGLAQLARQTADPLGLEVQVIHSGVDTKFFVPSLERRNGSPPRLLFVGRFHPQKGLSYLFEALGRLASKHDFAVDLVGDGPLRSDVENDVKLHRLTNRVTLHGWLTRDELLRHYQAADMFVLPSDDEGMSYALLEAMACGLPVVATRVSGTIESVDSSNGLLVAPKNPDELCDALGQMLADRSLRDRMGDAGRKRSLGWSWEAITDGYMEVLDSITRDEHACR